MTRSRSHADHDLLLVAALAAGDLTGPARDEAARHVEACPDCTSLAADLRTLAVATRELPAPPRPRDFTLSADDAARLRRRGWLGRLGLPAGSRLSIAQPVGLSLASLGVAGLLLAALPGASGAGAPSTPAARENLGVEQWADPSAGAGLDGQGGSGPRVNVDPTVPLAGAPGKDAAASAPPGEGAPPAIPSGDEAGAANRPADSTLAILSGSFLIVGLGLFGLGWTTRRLDGG